MRRRRRSRSRIARRTARSSCSPGASAGSEPVGGREHEVGVGGLVEAVQPGEDEAGRADHARELKQTLVDVQGRFPICFPSGRVVRQCVSLVSGKCASEWPVPWCWEWHRGSLCRMGGSSVGCQAFPARAGATRTDLPDSGRRSLLPRACCSSTASDVTQRFQAAGGWGPPTSFGTEAGRSEPSCPIRTRPWALVRSGC